MSAEIKIFFEIAEKIFSKKLIIQLELITHMITESL